MLVSGDYAIHVSFKICYISVVSEWIHQLCGNKYQMHKIRNKRTELNSIVTIRQKLDDIWFKSSYWQRCVVDNMISWRHGCKQEPFLWTCAGINGAEGSWILTVLSHDCGWQILLDHKQIFLANFSYFIFVIVYHNYVVVFCSIALH